MIFPTCRVTACKEYGEMVVTVLGRAVAVCKKHLPATEVIGEEADVKIAAIRAEFSKRVSELPA